MSNLPPHANVLTAPHLWMEGNALEQLARVASLPGCARAVGMPDLHAGPGVPIGAVFQFSDRILPSLVGADAGCGVLLVPVGRQRLTGDALERRVREVLAEDPLPDSDPAEVLRAVWSEGPRGLCRVVGVPERLRALAATMEPADVAAPLPDACAQAPLRLGSVGGGNHFAEIGQVEEVVDKELARTAGLRSGEQAVLVHTGSRGLGRALAERWQQVGEVGLPRDGSDARTYLSELAGAVNLARANRLVLAFRLLRALGADRPGQHGAAVDRVHNTVLAEPRGMVHRKGAAPALAGQLTVVLGSRGAASAVMLGLGAEECLCAVAHGAGRRMARGEARDKLKARYNRKSLARTALGSRVICEDPELLYEEHPDAYKDLGPVVDSLVAAGAARPVCRLRPVLTYKGH